MVSFVRSTLLTASLLAVRDNNLESRYFDALADDKHESIRALVAGTWAPVDLAMAHYAAMDGMALSGPEIERLGGEVSRRTHRTFATSVGRVSSALGVTPWLGFSKKDAIWDRLFEGGDLIVYKASESEAIVEIVQVPMLRSRYFRGAIISYLRELVTFLSSTNEAKELALLGGLDSIVIDFHWT